jgi:hypothetical protein
LEELEGRDISIGVNIMFIYIVCKDMDWIRQVRDMVYWRLFVSAVKEPPPCLYVVSPFSFSMGPPSLLSNGYLGLLPWE